jgi:N-acetyl-beta-hexosaminidase
MRNQRINQFIEQIDTLLDQYQWSKASIQIENLIKAYPDVNRVQQMRNKLVSKKQQHKDELLTIWDNAVKSHNTDKSLEILKELDVYLTPNEALALQEAAKDVYKTKLHNLGIQFSMAVSDKKWKHALDIGQNIINNFPNSKMSEEIRTKISVLKQNVQIN